MGFRLIFCNEIVILQEQQRAMMKRVTFFLCTFNKNVRQDAYVRLGLNSC